MFWMHLNTVCPQWRLLFLWVFWTLSIHNLYKVSGIQFQKIQIITFTTTDTQYCNHCVKLSILSEVRQLNFFYGMAEVSSIHAHRVATCDPQGEEATPVIMAHGCKTLANIQFVACRVMWSWHPWPWNFLQKVREQVVDVWQLCLWLARVAVQVTKWSKCNTGRRRGNASFLSWS